MRFILLSLGKKHDPKLTEAITDFTNRLGRFVPSSWHIIAAKDSGGDSTTLITRESELILNTLSKDAFVILLDKDGHEYSTEKLSKQLDTILSSSYSDVVFVIGGAYGVNEDVRKRAQLVWSFGKMTYPHQIMRLLLAEQLYRSMSLRAGLPYHHE